MRHEQKDATDTTADVFRCCAIFMITLSIAGQDHDLTTRKEASSKYGTYYVSSQFIADELNVHNPHADM